MKGEGYWVPIILFYSVFIVGLQHACAHVHSHTNTGISLLSGRCVLGLVLQSGCLVLQRTFGLNTNRNAFLKREIYDLLNTLLVKDSFLKKIQKYFFKNSWHNLTFLFQFPRRISWHREIKDRLYCNEHVLLFWVVLLHCNLNSPVKTEL